ncbi:glycyl-tRNA synthetase beta chain [Nitrosomonas eutropha]|uniref:Glycine--tRNA ligase beta subunit n=1 Tax=Nitrosomonas eutropha TaxID=916 RepID=A0A1I7EWR2_9PROT|nr:glycine--tRNA ligase subunit beta [Nitrosomonas eutropha]SFU28357.1 glycyl-tRNA synthetase beta chain [Nitrosomonas eutropha]
MTTESLLIELLTEELPPKSLAKLGNAFATLIADSLKQQYLTTPGTVPAVFASPRRLAVHLTAIPAQALDQIVTLKLMPVAVGLDAQGRPTPALHKKLAALGMENVAVSALKRVQESKAEMLFLEQSVTGTLLAAGLQKAVDEAIRQLPVPKMMTYQLEDGWENVHFIRPAHGLIALHGQQIVPISALGFTAGNTTRGHRFEAKQAELVIDHADHYEQILETEGIVIPGFDRRRSRIREGLETAARAAQLQCVEDAALLDEVTALVEHPNVLTGTFSADFLEVPQECLISTMKINQKYFPLLDAGGKLTNRFLIVSNITPADPGQIIAGNERVIRSRLADAKFFFDHDRKRTLASRLPDLDKVIYHHQLGSQGERTRYVRALARIVGQLLGDSDLSAQADQAAMLAKADLLTDMVGEFPELQGIMGRYYAQFEGMDETIAFAIEDHYKPRFAGDALPRSMTGICVALADKLETLISLFSIGQSPTGDKDPYALRRHALGVIRILIEKDLPVGLDVMISRAADVLRDEISGEQGPGSSHARPVTPQLTEQLQDFFYDRLASSLRDQGYTVQEVESVLNLRPSLLCEIPRRLAAVRAFTALPEAASLAAANKRVGNILKKSEFDATVSIDKACLQAPAEIALYRALSEIESDAHHAFQKGDYVTALQILAALKAPIDAFFDQVMVNDENEVLRRNRLALLATLQVTMNRVADISRLAA